MSTLYEGSYVLSLTKVPVDEEEDIALFAREWAARLYAEYSSCIDEPFLLWIGEGHTGREEPDWTAELQSRSDTEGKRPGLGEAATVVRLKARQSYFARNIDDPTANYAGYVEAGILVPQLVGEKDCDRATRSIAHVLLRLALSHYVECISQHYQQWDTAYLDAPTISKYLIADEDSNHDVEV